MLALIGQPSSRTSSNPRAISNADIGLSLLRTPAQPHEAAAATKAKPAVDASADATTALTLSLEDATAHADVVLTVDDVAALTRVGRNTIYSLVARNQIPHRRMGKQIRFSRAAVMSWLATSWQVAKEGK
jgi:excisionase family DNA binding protein